VRAIVIRAFAQYLLELDRLAGRRGVFARLASQRHRQRFERPRFGCEYHGSRVGAPWQRITIQLGQETRLRHRRLSRARRAEDR
jgi:hypothetical protein